MTTKRIKIKHYSWTNPQRDFWLSDKRFRLFCAGVGSGKTHCGAIEAFRQPAGSHGLICAPTFTMLRDSTLETFLRLARDTGTLAYFNKSDHFARLINGSTIAFRSADDPQRLRGPNCSFVWLDEAAMLPDATAWLILIGRLRLLPGRAWTTSTPAGMNWMHDVFVRNATPDHAIIRSRTNDNKFLPPGFVESLESQYPEVWREQEIGGQFVAVAGAIFQRAWFPIVPRVPQNLKWFRFWDLALSTKATADYSCSAAMAMDQDGIIYIRDLIRARSEWPDTKRKIIQSMLLEPTTEQAVEENSFGLAAVHELLREPSIANINFRGVRVDRDKVTRSLPLAARAEQGKVRLLEGHWNTDALDELIAFPASRHDDIVDSLSGGLAMISKPKRKILYA